MAEEIKKGSKTFIVKSTDIKIRELLDALCIIRDSILSFKKGKEYFIPVIAVQLRAILLDNRHDSKARLIDVAEYFSFPLDAYVFKNDQDLHNLRSSAGSELELLVDMNITVDKMHSNQKKESLLACLKESVVYYRNEEFSSKEIIEWYANQYGGAHYGKAFIKEFHEIQGVYFFNIDSLKLLLVKLAEIAFLSGLKLINYIASNSVFFILAIRDDPKSDVCIFDACYPGGPMRLNLFLSDKRTLILNLTDAVGRSFKVEGSILELDGKPKVINILVGNTNELFGYIKIRVDGREYAYFNCDFPIFFYSAWNQFGLTLNRSIDGEIQDYSFGMTAFGHSADMDGSKNTAYLFALCERWMRDETAKMDVFMPQSYALKPAGSNQFKYVGEFGHLTSLEFFSRSV